MQRLSAILPDVWELVLPRRGLLALGFVLMVINRVSGLVLPYSTKFLIDTVIVKHQIQRLRPLVLWVLLATAIQGATSFSLTQLLSKEAQRLIAELRQKVQAHIGRLSIAFHDSNKSGILVSRIMSDVEGVRNLLGTGLVDLTGGLLTACIALVVLFRLSSLMTMMAFGFLLCFALALRKAFGTIRPIFRERGKINAEVTGRLAESLGGVRVIKGYHAEQREANVFSQGVRRLLENVMRSSHRNVGDEPVREPVARRRRRADHVFRSAANRRGQPHHRRIFYLHIIPRLPHRAGYANRPGWHPANRSARRSRTHA